VDDDADARAALAEPCGKGGYTVETQPTHSKGLGKVPDFAPEILVLTDLKKMPAWTELELLRKPAARDDFSRSRDHRVCRCGDRSHGAQEARLTI